MAVKEKKAQDEFTSLRADGLETPSVSYCIYIGPTLGGLIHGAIFEKTLEETKQELSSIIKKYPLVEKLISTNLTIAEDREKVRKRGTLLHSYYVRAGATKHKED